VDKVLTIRAILHILVEPGKIRSAYEVEGLDVPEER
jgi:hypothetical protein